jgi:hypothetical protein
MRKMRHWRVVQAGVLGGVLLALGCDGENTPKQFTQMDSAVHLAPDASPGEDGSVQPVMDAAARDASSDDAGEADAAVERPFIASVGPVRIARGDRMVIRGRHLENARLVSIAGLTATLLAVSAAELVAEVPLEIPGDACEAPAEVVVETEAGLSEPFPLTLVRRAPTVTGLDGTDVRAGASFVVVGTHLEDAQVTLGDTELNVEDRSASALMVAVPREVSRGQAQLTIKGSCGLAWVMVNVLPPLPRILDIDQTNLAPNGVTLITFEMDDPSQLRGVRVEAGWVPVDDPKYCNWLPSADSNTTRTIAVRMPAGLKLGANNLTLAGMFGESLPVTVQGVPTPSLWPSPPVRLLWPGSRAADDGSFPVGTNSPFRLAEQNPDAPADLSLMYAFSFYEYPGSSACMGQGTIAGREIHCIGDCPYWSARCLESFGDVCYPISGSYRISSTTNTVAFDVDRSSSGGLSEHFVGGWASADGVSPPGVGDDTRDQRLVVRSTYSGLQLAIAHYLLDRCNQ